MTANTASTIRMVEAVPLPPRSRIKISCQEEIFAVSVIVIVGIGHVLYHSLFARPYV